jgi:hypothetical protein
VSGQLVFTIRGRNRTEVARVILGLLIAGGISGSELVRLQRHIERHDWIAADDVWLRELARVVNATLQLSPFPVEEC